MRVRPTLAVGYDAVIPIDPEIYEITEDARGRAYAFEMDDAAREDITDAVRAVLDDSHAVERVEVESGYLRVRVAPSDPVRPTALLNALRSVPDEYNRRHATAPELDGLYLSPERFLGTYRPESAPDRDAFLSRRADARSVPDADGPVWSYRRDNGGEHILQPNQRCRYQIVLPFDPGMYEPTTPIGGPGVPAVRWDDDAVRDALRVTVENIPPWPKRAKNTPRIDVYPGYLLVDHNTDNLRAGPKHLAESVATAFLRYNRARPVDEEHSSTHTTRPHPPIAFRESAYIASRDLATGAEAWIADHDLDAVDGEPVAPTPEEDVPKEEADAGGVLSRFTE